MPSYSKMAYVRLGGSGLKISKIILGCSIYGSSMKNERDSISDIKTAYDMGVNAFDTANVYSNGQSEVILGKAIREHNLPRAGIVIMTKVGGLPDSANHLSNGHLPGHMDVDADSDDYINQHGLSRKHIFESIKQSLKRLQMDYVDVLQCQIFDEKTPIPETMQALHDVVKAGYARYIGMGTCRAWEFQAMQSYAINHKLTPFLSMQTNYNLLYREDEREILPMLKYFNVSALPWSTLAQGALVLPLAEQLILPDDRIPGGRTPWHGQIIRRVEEVSRYKRSSIPQVAIAWELSRPGVDSLLLSSPSIQHLAAAIDAFDLELSLDDIDYLEELYQPQRPRIDFN